MQFAESPFNVTFVFPNFYWKVPVAEKQQWGANTWSKFKWIHNMQ